MESAPCIRRRGCSRTLYGVPGRLVTASVIRPGEQTACRFAVAYEGAGVVWGVAWSVASALNGVTLLVGTRSGVAPKAPLKGELAARNALSEGFCGRASGAWSNNALPTSLLLRKTSQSASLTAPLSGEPLAFAALRVTTSSVALVDAVGRRPRWSCVTAAVRKRKRSGKRSAHQLSGYGCTRKSAW